MNPLLIVLIVIFVLLLFAGIRIVRPTHRALIERLGQYNRFANPGFHWIIPVIEKMYQVNTTEQMVDAEPQEIITNDNLNARVDAQVYFKIKHIILNHPVSIEPSPAVCFDIIICKKRLGITTPLQKVLDTV